MSYIHYSKIDGHPLPEMKKKKNAMLNCIHCEGKNFWIQLGSCRYC